GIGQLPDILAPESELRDENIPHGCGIVYRVPKLRPLLIVVDAYHDGPALAVETFLCLRSGRRFNGRCSAPGNHGRCLRDELPGVVTEKRVVLALQLLND